jgi:hypothetical protein
MTPISASENHSVDQLGARAGRHLFVKRVKRRLVQPATLHELAWRTHRRQPPGRALILSLV